VCGSVSVHLYYPQLASTALPFLPSSARSANTSKTHSKPRSATISGPALSWYHLRYDRRFAPLARASKGFQSFEVRGIYSGQKKALRRGPRGNSEEVKRLRFLALQPVNELKRIARELVR
jgi:hypothetical protein